MALVARAKMRAKSIHNPLCAYEYSCACAFISNVCIRRRVRVRVRVYLCVGSLLIFLIEMRQYRTVPFRSVAVGTAPDEKK